MLGADGCRMFGREVEHIECWSVFFLGMQEGES